MQALKRWWTAFEDKHTTAAQFIVFFILSNGITVLQLILMPAFKAAFAHTSLVDTAFQFLPSASRTGTRSSSSTTRRAPCRWEEEARLSQMSSR